MGIAISVQNNDTHQMNYFLYADKK